MFPEDKIRKIFSNIEQISSLHHKLLRELELAFNQSAPENSCIANAFLRNVSCLSTKFIFVEAIRTFLMLISIF